MLELDDIQHFLIARPPALAARYEFLSFHNAEGARTWLAGILAKVGTAQTVGSSHLDSRWVTVAFTWNGRPSEYPRRHRGKSSRSLDWGHGKSPSSRHCRALCPQCGGTRAMHPGASRVPLAVHRCRGAFILGPRGPTAVWLPARTLWLSRSALAARDRRNPRGTDAWLRAGHRSRRILSRLSGRRGGTCCAATARDPFAQW